MCGRFALKATPEDLKALFGYLDADDFPPRYNIAPTQPIGVVRLDERKQRRFALVRWGLVPAFVKEPRSFGLLINARSESAANNNAFKHALKYRRCLIPASGFYEWRKGRGTVPQGPKKQAFWIKPRGDGVVAFAGLWETWTSPDGSEIDSGCILTTAANHVVAPIHDRMPVIVAPDEFERWLASRDPVGDMLRPAPDSLLEAFPVGDGVNNADNDGPDLLKPVAANDDTDALPLFSR